jgi:hypothetical protein
MTRGSAGNLHGYTGAICYPLIPIDPREKVENTTIMVENKNISAYIGAPPPTDGTGRIKITGGPLYSREEVLACHRAVTGGRTPDRDIDSLELCLAMIPKLVAKAITTGRYKGSEWCEVKNFWVAADAYVFSDVTHCDVTGKDVVVELYLKFAIDRKGSLIYLNSLHSSK